MRVGMYYNNNDVRLQEVPLPQIGSGEFLLRVEASGICGSDVMEWYRLAGAPRVLGHEVTGQIVALGEGVHNFKEGDRVVVTHHVPCNACSYCLRGQHTLCDTLHHTNFDPGGFAEYIRVPAINVERGVFLLDEEVTYEQGSFTEPLGCAVRGLRVAGMETGQCVVIIGSGLAGLLFIQLCHAVGAGRVIATDIVASRVEAAGRLGADVAVHAGGDLEETVRQTNHGRLADLVVVCTGAPSAMGQALDLVDDGGTVLVFAPMAPEVMFPMDMNRLWSRGITVTTTYGASPADLAQALELIRSGRVRPETTVTHRLSLEEIGRGFRLVADAQDSLKVIIQPQK